MITISLDPLLLLQRLVLTCSFRGPVLFCQYWYVDSYSSLLVWSCHAFIVSKDFICPFRNHVIHKLTFTRSRLRCHRSGPFDLPHNRSQRRHPIPIRTLPAKLPHNLQRRRRRQSRHLLERGPQPPDPHRALRPPMQRQTRVPTKHARPHQQPHPPRPWPWILRCRRRCRRDPRQ